MSHLCPDDQQPLRGSGAVESCTRCGGILCLADDLTQAVPGARLDVLVAETRIDAAASIRPRACPGCDARMVPQRIGKMEAWVERCPSCERLWIERQDARTLVLQAKQAAMQGAYASFSAAEKQELAKDLAVASVGEGYPPSAFHQFLATLGLPVIRRTRGNTVPVVTWVLGLAMAGVFLLEQSEGGAEVFARLHGYDTAHPELLSAVAANFLHFGVLHVLGNLYFLLSFGDGVEQRVPHLLVLVIFLVLGTLALYADALAESAPTVIAGASGGIAALMGACVVLQPQAKVVVRIGIPIVELPIWAYAVIELLYQGVMSLLDVAGTAWTSHIAGLLLGLAAGVVARRLWPIAAVGSGAAA